MNTSTHVSRFVAPVRVRFKASLNPDNAREGKRLVPGQPAHPWIQTRLCSTLHFYLIPISLKLTNDWSKLKEGQAHVTNTATYLNVTRVLGLALADTLAN